MFTGRGWDRGGGSFREMAVNGWSLSTSEITNTCQRLPGIARSPASFIHLHTHTHSQDQEGKKVIMKRCYTAQPSEAGTALFSLSIKSVP